MRKTLCLLLTLLVTVSYGQNYKLFNGSSKKLFTSFPVSSNAYSLAFDSVRAVGTDSVYYNFFTFRDTTVSSDSCAFWGSQECYKQDFPTWIGKGIHYDNLGAYQFYNRFNGTLSFDFNLASGDTSLFFQDGVQRFSLIYEKSDTVTILNNMDSARFYKIYHEDLSGNVINSALNGKDIIVGKEWGLIQFLQVDSFPLVLKSLALIGNATPAGGLNTFTSEVLYDYQPGDEIQYHSYHADFYIGNLYLPTYYNSYTKFNFLTKIVNTDSIIYTAGRYFFNVDSTIAIYDTVTVKYYRYDTIASVPYEFYNGSTRRLYVSNYCGQNLWTYINIPNPYIGYCAPENCWGFIDTNGPVPSESTTYVAKLGIFDSHSNYSDPAATHTTESQIVYYKINGIACNSPVYLGINGIDKINDQIKMLPNPAKDKVSIITPPAVKSFALFDLNGIIVMEKMVTKSQESIDINKLSAGVYFARFTFFNNSTTSKKLIVTKD